MRNGHGVKIMASEMNEKRTPPERITVASSEFRADSSVAMRAVAAGKTVTVTDAQGTPRMHILRQTEPLED